MSAHMLAHMSTHMSVHMSVHMSAHMSAHMSVRRPPDGEFKNLVTGMMEKRFDGGNIEDELVDKTSNKQVLSLV